MSKSHSTNKPQKPYPEFPLTPHPSGRWCKKIRGRLVYFGRIADGWEPALDKFNREKDDLYAGRKSREQKPPHATIRDLVNDFWNSKRHRAEAGEITPRTLDDYERICDLIVEHFGKHRALADIGPDDFLELRQKLTKKAEPDGKAGKRSAVSLANLIQRIRTVFKFAFDIELIDKPTRFGPDFKRPSKKSMRLEKAKKGPRLFSADEIRALLDAACVQLRAMILLAVNCGYGNQDVGTLPMTALDLQRGWIGYHRPKTGIERRCPLWPETVEALKEWLALRPQPRNEKHAELVFLTRRGEPWAKDIPANPLSAEMRKLLDRLGINGHRNFYTLRHVFQTIGDEAKDFVAVRSIMGHASEDISDVYRESVSDARLLAVTEHVRKWLFGDADGGGKILPMTKRA